MSFYETGNLPNFSVIPTPTEYDKKQDVRANTSLTQDVADKLAIDGTITIGTVIYIIDAGKFKGLTSVDAGVPQWALLN